jgi:acetyl esterase/lipase
MAFRVPSGFVRRLLRVALKPFLSPAFPFWFQRAWMTLASNLNLLSRAASVSKLDIDGMFAVRVCPKESDPDRTILYLHGGGYCTGSWRTQKGLISQLAVDARAAVYAPHYRLAPEHPHPAALDDALNAYRWVLDQGASPDRLSLAGDSAGGGLALALAIAIRDSDLPAPASLVLVSPWLDLRGDSPSMTENEKVDPMLKPAWSRQCATAYLGGREPEDPACSPLYARHEGLPPVLIQTGTDEIIVDDSIRFAERAREAGVDVTLQVFEGLWHEFQIHAGLLREADQAIEEIAKFLHAY